MGLKMPFKTWRDNLWVCSRELHNDIDCEKAVKDETYWEFLGDGTIINPKSTVPLKLMKVFLEPP